MGLTNLPKKGIPIGMLVFGSHRKGQLIVIIFHATGHYLFISAQTIFSQIALIGQSSSEFLKP
jgi:hypothetical protein